MKLINLFAGAALALAMAAGSTGAQASNLITNGSFETGDLTGWTSDSLYGLNPFGTTYGVGMDGTYWHWMAGYETPITTSQTVSGLTVGTTYALTFITASEGSNSDLLDVSVNGGANTAFSAPPYIPGGGPNGGFWDVWAPHELDFVATGASATITFSTVGLNAACCDVGLDKVSLSAVGGVPEPATWAMMLVGFGGLGAVLRAHRRADRNLAALTA
jgi:hypothetical protein